MNEASPSNKAGLLVVFMSISCKAERGPAPVPNWLVINQQVMTSASCSEDTGEREAMATAMRGKEVYNRLSAIRLPHIVRAILQHSALL